MLSINKKAFWKIILSISIQLNIYCDSRWNKLKFNSIEASKFCLYFLFSSTKNFSSSSLSLNFPLPSRLLIVVDEEMMLLRHSTLQNDDSQDLLCINWNVSFSRSSFVHFPFQLLNSHGKSESCVIAWAMKDKEKYCELWWVNKRQNGSLKLIIKCISKRKFSIHWILNSSPTSIMILTSNENVCYLRVQRVELMSPSNWEISITLVCRCHK